MSLGQVAGAVKIATAYKAVTLASAATTTGAAVDCKGYDEVTYVFDTGTFTGAGCTAAVKITECDTSGGSYSDITGAAFANVTASNDDANYIAKVRVNPAKPFQQVSVTTSGTVTTAPISVSALLSKSHNPAGGYTTPAFDVTAA